MPNMAVRSGPPALLVVESDATDTETGVELFEVKTSDPVLLRLKEP